MEVSNNVNEPLENLKEADILVVDDTPANLKMLSIMLKDQGYKVRPVPSGKLALKAADSSAPDLILLDINMPEMDGYEVCQHLKESETLRDIPIIFISALTETIDKVKAFSMGGVDYVTKPFHFEEVRARVTTHLKLRDAQIRLEQNNQQLQELNQNLERAQELLSISFQRYMSSQLLERILKSSKPVSLTGEKKEVTVLMSDIRGFTTLAENMTTEKLVKFLNQYFEAMINIVLKNEGLLDKFMGDAVLALFGAIYSHEDDPLRAVVAAIEMQKKVRELNSKWSEENMPQIEIGVGISTGEIIVGNIGSDQRMEFTGIGQDVNYAQRIEALTKVFPSSILLNQSTYEQVKDVVNATQHGPIKIKGKKDAILVYGVEGLK
jgi:class 3 adenylate cyclase